MLALLLGLAVSNTQLVAGSVGLADVRIGDQGAPTKVLVAQQYGVPVSGWPGGQRQAVEDLKARVASAENMPQDPALSRAAARAVMVFAISAGCPQANTTVFRSPDGHTVVARMYVHGLRYVFKIEDVESGDAIAEVGFADSEQSPAELNAWRDELFEVFRSVSAHPGDKEEQAALAGKIDQLIKSFGQREASGSASVIMEINGQLAVLSGQDATRANETKELLALWPNLSADGGARLGRALHLLQAISRDPDFIRAASPPALPSFLIDGLPGDLGAAKLACRELKPRVMPVLGDAPEAYVQEVIAPKHWRAIDFTRSFRSQVKALLRHEP